MTPAQRAACVEVIRVLDQFRDARVLHGSGWRDAVSRWKVPPNRQAAFDALLPACGPGDEWHVYAGDVRAVLIDALDTQRPDVRAALFAVAPGRTAIPAAAWEVIAAAGGAP